MAPDWKQLHELQDWVLKEMKAVEHGFYLTGGTALSRGYYGHRYSEDLDFFVNDHVDFQLWRDRCLNQLASSCPAGTALEITLRDIRFGRAFLHHGRTALKLEFVNDVPFHVGKIVEHASLGRLDNKENILANKISALMDRSASKDLADIFWLCCRDKLSISDALENASGKAAGLFPPLVSKKLTEGAELGLPDVFWIKSPTPDEFTNSLKRLADSLIAI
jgi:hypothetical protein